MLLRGACGTHAGHMRDTCGTHAGHFRDTCGTHWVILLILVVFGIVCVIFWWFESILTFSDTICDFSAFQVGSGVFMPFQCIESCWRWFGTCSVDFVRCGALLFAFERFWSGILDFACCRVQCLHLKVCDVLSWSCVLSRAFSWFLLNCWWHVGWLSVTGTVLFSQCFTQCSFDLVCLYAHFLASSELLMARWLAQCHGRSLIGLLALWWALTIS